jgi:hypothetical protein
MNKEEKETTNAPNNREKLRKLREKKAENEQFRKEISHLNTLCLALSGDIKSEKEKNENLKKEIDFRKKHLEEIEKNYKSFNERTNPDSKKYVDQMKNKMIKKKLEEIFEEKIPELNANNNKADSPMLGEENEFHNLVTNFVNVAFLQSDSIEGQKFKEKKQSFRICAKSNFKALKKIACQYWDIENENDYVITDDAEALICNEEMYVDNYLRDYSVLANNFKLISIQTVKLRTKLIGMQENRMRENNKFGNKNHKRENLNTFQSASDNSIYKIKEFFNEYRGLKPFILVADEKGASEGDEKKIDQIQAQAKNIETSFWTLLILVIFILLNTYFIFTNRDVGRNNLKIAYATKLFNNGKITNYFNLYNYVVTELGFQFFGTSKWNTDNLPGDDEKFKWVEKSNNTFNKVNPNKEKFYKLTKNFQNSSIPDPEFLYNYINKSKDETINFKIVSSIHIILYRVKKKTECNKSTVIKNIINTNEKCYEVYYNPSTRDENFVYNSLDPYFLQDGNITEKLQKFINYTSNENAGVDIKVI